MEKETLWTQSEKQQRKRDKVRPAISAEDAIAQWIRAEHAFRLGPDAYSTRTQDWLLDAEETLRWVLTGKSQLSVAFERLQTRKEKE